MPGYIFGGLGLILLGIFIVVGRLSRWQWFNEHYKLKAISDALGEKNADAFYIFLAVLIAVLGILIMTRIVG